MIDNNAHLVYIVSQTKQNVEFLLSQGQISSIDGEDILAKLSKVLRNNVSKQLEEPKSRPMPEFAIIPSNSRPAQYPAGGNMFHARAIWGYNEQRQVTRLHRMNTSSVS